MTCDLCWQPYRSMSHQNDRNEHSHMSGHTHRKVHVMWYKGWYLHVLHPSKPQRLNKTRSSETKLWLWKMSVLHSSLWGGYEIKNPSSTLIVSLFFPKHAKINTVSVNCKKELFCVWVIMGTSRDISQHGNFLHISSHL